MVSWYGPNRAGEGEMGRNSKVHISAMKTAALGTPNEGNPRDDRVSERQVNLRIQSFKYLLRAYYGTDAILEIGNSV